MPFTPPPLDTLEEGPRGFTPPPLESEESPSALLTDPVQSSVNEGILTRLAISGDYGVSPFVPREESAWSDLATAAAMPLEDVGKASVALLNAPTHLRNWIKGSTDEEHPNYVEPAFKQGEPLVKIADPISDEEAALLSPGWQKFAGVYNSIAHGGNALTTPENLALTPLFATRLAKPLLAYLLGTTAAQEPAAIESAIAVSDDPNATPMQKWEAIGQAAVVNPAFIALLGAGLRGKPAPGTEQIFDPAVEAAAIEGGSPMRRLGIKLNQNALDTPELAPLVERGLREAQSPIINPTEIPAVDLLRRQQSQIIQEPARALLERSGGGEAMFGKTSFMREAEAPTVEGSRIIPVERSIRQNAPEAKPATPTSGTIEATPVRSAEPVAAEVPKETVAPELTVEAVTSLDPASGAPLSSIDALINKLESLRLSPNPQTAGRMYSLPHPDAIKAIGQNVWNGALDIAIASIKAGKAVGDAVADALSYVRKNASGFDESKLANNFNYIFSNEKVRGPKSYPVQGENVEMRKSAARAAESESIPEPVRETIAKAPESFYQQQSTKEVNKLIGSMSDMEVSAVPRDSDLYVAAKLEQSKRLFNAGKNDEGYNVFVELEKEGTRLGQLINQFKLLDGASPTAVATVVDRMLVKAKRDPLTKSQRETLVGKSQLSIDANRQLESAKETWMKEPTAENASKADKALEAANETDLDVQRMVLQFTPKTIPGTLKSILQGNLLTPISEVANLVGNMTFLPFRATGRTIAASLDVIDSYIRSKPRELAVSPVRGTIEAAKGAGRGLAQVPDVLLKGSGDILKGERTTGLQPLKAWATQFAKNPDVPTVDGKLPFSSRIQLALEGTFGMPAAVMLRGLQAGDLPFREAARARIIANEAKLKKLSPDHLSMAQKFPELFFDSATLKRIQEETLYSIFQRRSETLNHVVNLLASRGEWVDLAATTVVPFKVTPWNIVSEILSHNPLVAASRTAHESKAGSSRAAKINAGKFVVGSILTAGGLWLYKNGLIAPSMDTPDEQQKARLLAGEVMPPNHVNVSGLERALQDGDPSFKPGDRTINVFRAGGLAGSFFYMIANIGRDAEKQPADESAMGWSVLRNSTLEQARFGMNQSFLQGVGGLFQAIKSGETDNYVQSLANTVGSIPLPNTLSVLSRSTRPYKIEPSGIAGLFKQKLGIFGADDEMPVKRGLWGEPLPETPKDRSAVLYHFFDITKEQTVTDDPVAIEIYKLWRSTANTTVIPTPPGKSVTILSETYNLNPEQHSRLAELVGKSRRQYAESVIQNPEWWKGLDTDTKIKVLQRVYDMGSQVGKGAFYNEYKDQLSAKPERAGFAPPPIQ